MKTKIGFLKYGDYFIFDGEAYKIGHFVNVTTGYVACTHILTRKVKRMHIDLEVEKCDTITCADREDAKKIGDSIGWSNVVDWEFYGYKVKLITKPLKEKNMTIEEIEKKIDQIEKEEFLLQMKDHWSEADFAESRKNAEEIRKLKKELEEMEDDRR